MEQDKPEYTFEELKKLVEGRVKELKEACRIKAPQYYQDGLKKDISCLLGQLEKFSPEPDKQYASESESELETLQKRLTSEPLMPTEEIEKKEQYSGNMWSENMVDPEEIEKDCIKEERKSFQKKLTGLIEDHHRTGWVNKEGMSELEKQCEENECDGKPDKDIEESYGKFKKEVKRNSSKYG